jgi:hypothetical protein
MSQVSKILIAIVFTATAGALLPVAHAQKAEQSNDDAVKRATAAIMRDYEQGAAADVLSLCKQKWPDDYVMQKHCVETQTEARAKVQAVDVLGSKVKMKIWAKCSGDWTDKRTDLTDWVMMSHCYDTQWSAYRALNQ